MSKKSKHIGMMKLDKDNFIIRSAMERKFAGEKGGEYFNIKCCDNDEVLFHLVSKKQKGDDAPDTVELSVAIPCWAELSQHGVEDMLKNKYAGLVHDTTEKEYNVTIQVDINDLGSREPADIIALFARLKVNCMGAPLEKLSNALNANDDVGKPVTLNYRQDEQIFFIPRSDRVQVLVSLRFRDPVERAMAYVFATELDEDHKVFNQPIVSYKPMDNPPKALLECEGVKAKDDSDIGYVTIGVRKKEINTPKQMQNTIDNVMGLRTYLDYHLKCSKSHLMSMMRSSCSKLLKAKARCNAKGKTASYKDETS